MYFKQYMLQNIDKTGKIIKTLFDMYKMYV